MSWTQYYGVQGRYKWAPKAPYKVLGLFKPEKWDARLIGLELCRLTAEMSYEPHHDPIHGPLERVPWHSTHLHAEVRKRSFKTKMAEGWHYDGDNTPGANPHCGIVLWASNHPTLIKERDSLNERVYQPRPYELVWFNNFECLHRRPAGVPRIRWVFRQRVAL